MNGPSVTVVPRTVFAADVPWSWCPPSSRPVAPHFSYQAPTSAYQAPYSGLSGAGSFGVSMISITYFTRVSLSMPRPQRAPAPTPRTPTPRFRHRGKNFLRRSGHQRVVVAGGELPLGLRQIGLLQQADQVDVPAARAPLDAPEAEPDRLER